MLNIETLVSIPAASINNVSEEPPKLIKGRGTPVIGRRPVTAPRFTNT